LAALEAAAEAEIIIIKHKPMMVNLIQAVVVVAAGVAQDRNAVTAAAELFLLDIWESEELRLYKNLQM
jgi:hypothetical protein